MNQSAGESQCAGLRGPVMPEQKSLELSTELHTWQTREEFKYEHRWEPGMFVIRDNRSCLHGAYGGYAAYDRELHRTTVYNEPRCVLKTADPGGVSDAAGG